MVAACPDPNDQIANNKLNLSPINVIDPKGRYTLSQIDAVTEQVAQSILNDAETNPLSKAISSMHATFNPCLFSMVSIN